MAIKIPSKHIYSMDNPKIRDNFIDNVEVNMTVISPDNEYETPIYNKDFNNINATVTTFENNKTLYEDAYALNAGGNTARNIRGASIIKYKYSYIKIPDIYIPKLENNKYISKIYDKTNEDGNENIKYSLNGTQTIYDLMGTYQPSTNKFEFVEETQLKENNFSSFNSQDFIKDVKDTLLANLSVTNVYDLQAQNFAKYENNNFVIGSYIRANSNNNWQPAIVTIDNKKEIEIGTTKNLEVEILDSEYKINSFELLYSVEVNILSTLLESTTNFNNFTGNSICYGNTIKYISSGLAVTIYGNTIGISLEDGTITYGSGTKPFSLDGNELLQDSATTNGKLTTQHLAENILAQYKNGKETATLLCDIGEYYEQDGTKKIGIEMQDRMSFHEHDLVIPYVFGADGKDRPMSRYSNGEPKVFEVVSVKRFFDGAVWQELSLLEFTKTT